jgi:DNA-binding CsgD family transcriptional regulator
MNDGLAIQSQSRLIPPARFALTLGKLVLGRSSKCDLVVKHETISRRHAEIIVTRQGTTVRDLGSRNGVFIDSKRVLTGTLQLGQHVTFGNVGFVTTSAETGLFESDSEIETVGCDKPELPLATQADLSRAKRRVLDLLLQGLSEKQIAARLHLSSTTIHNHIQAIYRVFKVHTRSELLVRLLAKNDDQNAAVL